MSLRIVKLVFCSNKNAPEEQADALHYGRLMLGARVFVCLCALPHFFFSLCSLLSASIIYLLLFVVFADLFLFSCCFCSDCSLKNYKS